MNIEIINGPNLNLLGIREPEVYGNEHFDACLSRLHGLYPDIIFGYFQSNVEGELVNRLQEVGFTADGVILNAGAYTHTSVALHDCIKAITSPVVEVHLSNIHARESYRHTSLITSACQGMISGFGTDSYRLAVEALLHR
ncbi:MAG: 3-dehydroquinate dehydratase [Prevotellaceae bacterium]|nr:3-dehydroquinate dehydratase [Prevotellaceae bacterium]